MKLSLSVRIAESFHDKKKSTLTLEDLIQLAQSIGYEALCMRASQAGIETPEEKLKEIRARLDAANLKVSMVTGDFDVPRNDELGPKGLRNITPYLDVAEALGADLIRICMKTGEDIVWAQRAADEARERAIRLAHQSHLASLFETVEGSLETLRAVDRDNFGIIYEPANWMLIEEDYQAAIPRLQPWIMNAYLQNHIPNPQGEEEIQCYQRGTVRCDHIGIWDAGGVECDAVLQTLKDVGYDGHVTAHQAFAGIMSPADAARRSFEYLQPRVI